MMKDKPPLSPPPASEMSFDEVSNVSSHQTDVSYSGLDTGRYTTPRMGQKKAGGGGGGVGGGAEMSATKVFVRVRPFNQKELNTKLTPNGEEASMSADGSGGGDGDGGAIELRPIVKIDESKPSFITTLDPQRNYAPRNTYIFERCFDSSSLDMGSVDGAKTLEEGNVEKVTEDDIKAADQDQALLYGYVGKPVLENAIEGYNGCVFAYGQTGSGKTFTMMGPPSLFNTPTTAGGGTSPSSTPGRKFSRASTTIPFAERTSVDPTAKRLALSTQGIIPRLSRELFEELNRSRTKDSARSFRVELEYFEIYNEKVMDLLHTGATGSATELKVRNAASGPYVEGLQRMHVESAEEVLRFLRRGNSERHTASTKMNDRSSRSHAILSLYLTQMRITTVSEDGGEDTAVATPTSGGNNNPLSPSSTSAASGGRKLRSSAAHADNEIVERRKSKINLVDLAGSERTGASEVTGKHFKEATNINLSLTTLGRVIDALADLSQVHTTHNHQSDASGGGRSAGSAKSGGARGVRGGGDGANSGGPTSTAIMSGYGIFVPYRDSNLTWLLRDSLGGNSKTTMIATISPHCTNFDEACQTLRYASRAKQIMTKAVVNEDPQQRLIKQLSAEVERLKRALASGKGAGMDQEDEDYMEELRARVRELEAELADKSSDLDRAEEEIVTLRSALQQKASLSKNEVKAVAKEGEAKALKLRADVQKLETENMNMAVLENDLRREQEKVKAMERRVALISRQAEKESKGQQTAIRKLEKENRELEAERDALRLLRADMKAAEEREAELVACLQQMEQEREQVRATQKSTVVTSGGGGAMQLSEASIRRLEALGLLPPKDKSRKTKPATDEPLQLGKLVDSLVRYAATAQEEARQAQQQTAKLMDERKQLLRQKEQDSAAGHNANRALRRQESISSSVVGRAVGGAASPRTPVSRGDNDNEKKLAKQLKHTENELAALRDSTEAERAELQKQILEKTDANRRSQMELKRVRDELKAEREQQAANEKRLINEHSDAMRRLQEEVREKKVAVKETRRQQKDFSATLSAAHEKELSDLAEEKQALQASLAKMTKEHKALQKKSKEVEEKLASAEGIVSQYQGTQVEDFLSRRKGGKVTREQFQAVVESHLRNEAVVRAALEKEADAALQLLYTQDEVLLSLSRERAAMREEMAHSLALRDEQAAADVAAVQDALDMEKAEHARKQELVKEFMQAVKAQREAAGDLQAKLDSQQALLKTMEATNHDQQHQIDSLEFAKSDLLLAIEDMNREHAAQEERIRELQDANAREVETHAALVQRLEKDHSTTLAAEQQLQRELTEKCAQMASRLVELERQQSDMQIQHSETVAGLRRDLEKLEQERASVAQAAHEWGTKAREAVKQLLEEQLARMQMDATVARVSCARVEAQERLSLALALRREAESMARTHIASLEHDLHTVQETVLANEEALRIQRQEWESDKASAIAALVAEKDQFEHTIAELKSRYDESLKAQNTTHEELEAERAAHTTAVSRSEAAIAALQQQLDAAKADSVTQVAEAKRASEEMEKQRTELEAKLATAEGQTQALAGQLEALRSEHASITQDHEAKQRGFQEQVQAADAQKEKLVVMHREELAALEAKLNALKTRFGDSLKTQADLQEQLQSMTRSSQSAQAEKEATILSLTAKLENETAEHEAAVAALTSRKEDLEKLSAHLQQEVDELKAAKTALDDRIGTLTRAQGSTNEEHARQLRALSHQMDVAHAEKESLAAQLQSTEESMAGERGRLADLQQSSQSLATQLEKDKTAAEKTLENVKSELKKAQEHLAATRTELLTQSEEAAKQRAESEALVANLQVDLKKSEESRRLLVRRGLEAQATHTARIEELASDLASAQAQLATETAANVAHAATEERLRAQLADAEAAANDREAAHAAELSKWRADMEAKDTATAAAHREREQEREEERKSHTVTIAELQSTIADLHDHVEAGKRSITSLEAQLAQTQDALANAKTSHETASRNAEVQRATLEQEVAQLTGARDEALSRLQTTEAEGQILAEQLASEKRARTDDNAESKKAVEALAKEMTDRTAEIARLKDEHAKERTALSEEVARTRSERDCATSELSAKLAATEDKLAHTQEELEAMKRKLAREREEAATTISANGAALQSLQVQLDSMLDAKTREVEQLEAALAKEAAACEAAKTSFRNLQDRFDALEADLAKQKAASARMQSDLEEEKAALAEELEQVKRNLAESESVRKASIDHLEGQRDALRQQLQSANTAAAAWEERLHAAEKNFSSNEAKLSESAAKQESAISELRAELERLNATCTAQDTEIADLKRKILDDTKAFTAAAEKREQELTRLREDLEFRANLDLCEADRMNFTGGPPNMSFSDAKVGGTSGAHEGRATVGGGLGSMLSSLFGKGKDSVGSVAGGSAAPSAATANRRASFIPALGSSSNQNPNSASLAAQASNNNSMAELTVHDVLSFAPPVGACGTPTVNSAAAASAVRPPQQQQQQQQRVAGGPAPFERRASQHAGAGASAAHRSAKTAGKPSSASHPHTAGPLQPKQENIPDPTTNLASDDPEHGATAKRKASSAQTQ